MTKKLSFILLLFFTAIAAGHENHESNIGPGPLKGLPGPGEGIKIIPLSEMNLTESKKIQTLNKLAEVKRKGYLISNSAYPARLLYLGQGEKKSKVDESGSSPYDTRLKKQLSQINLSFSFKGISFIKPDDIIGYSAIGAWKNGWTGVSQVFNNKAVGTCSFRLLNMSQDGGTSAHLMKESVSYDINHKPTILAVTGSQEKPRIFLYAVRWLDSKNYYDLKCASKIFDKDITKRVIKLAQEIDVSVAKL